MIPILFSPTIQLDVIFFFFKTLIFRRITLLSVAISRQKPRQDLSVVIFISFRLLFTRVVMFWQALKLKLEYFFFVDASTKGLCMRSALLAASISMRSNVT